MHGNDVHYAYEVGRRGQRFGTVRLFSLAKPLTAARLQYAIRLPVPRTHFQSVKTSFDFEMSGQISPTGVLACRK